MRSRPSSDPTEITRYLQAMEEGDSSAMDRVLPYVYDDLRQLAEQMFQDQWRHHTLQPTALVHEAYLRIAKASGGGFENRKHFLKVAAMAMRQLLTDYARARNAEKREGGCQRVVLGEGEQGEEGDASGGVDLLALDEALRELAELDERQARIVELRFLTGLTVEETAEVLDVSERTVYLDWKMARLWLERRLEEA
jgi:RNA polymerase sigma factor (TIGR02999 family)